MKAERWSCVHAGGGETIISRDVKTVDNVKEKQLRVEPFSSYFSSVERGQPMGHVGWGGNSGEANFKVN